jgi:hypothetical protein
LAVTAQPKLIACFWPSVPQGELGTENTPVSLSTMGKEWIGGKMTKWKVLGLAITFGLVSMTARAGTVNVLWYTGGVDTGSAPTYSDDVATLAADSVSAGQNTWNVTLWSGGAVPSGTFNVLVVASPEGGWSPFPTYTDLNAAALSFDPATQRVMLTGQDADWHFRFGPGPTPFDGPQGFLVDSINWAASGTGLGLVALGQDGMGSCAFGGSGGALLGLSGFSNSGCGTDNVVIPGGVAANPVNTGLTSAGLSNWGQSAHVEFTGLSSAWTGINIDGNETSFGGDATCSTDTPDGGCDYVTIVSASSVGGGITPGGPPGSPTPEPSSLLLLGSGLAGLFFCGKKKLLNA